jgi:7-cyano-7-deazaguanine synthase
MAAVVLFSGGVDSTTTTVVAVKDGHRKIHLLSVRYGSRHQDAEQRAALALYTKFIASWPSVDWTWSDYTIPELFKGGGKSSLMGEVEVPQAMYQDVDTEGPSSTEVPFRNSNLISIAVTTAMKKEFDKVYIGVHASDHNRWAYPKHNWGSKIVPN